MLRLANTLARSAVLLAPFAAVVIVYRYLFSTFAVSSVMTATVFLACAAMAALMLRATAQRRARRNHAPELAEIFESFAQRHRLAVNVAEQNSTSYTFEAGGRLKRWLVLSVVEGDDVLLDFGDYQFRRRYSPQSREAFERVLDAWVDGRARIVSYSGGGQSLETATAAGWAEFASRNVGPLRGRPLKIVTNAA